MDCGTCEQYVQFHEQQWPRYRDTIILSEEPCDNEYIREQCPLTCNICRPGNEYITEQCPLTCNTCRSGKKYRGMPTNM